jgi:hypothetical protein
MKPSQMREGTSFYPSCVWWWRPYLEIEILVPKISFIKYTWKNMISWLRFQNNKSNASWSSWNLQNWAKELNGIPIATKRHATYYEQPQFLLTISKNISNHIFLNPCSEYLMHWIIRLERVLQHCNSAHISLNFLIFANKWVLLMSTIPSTGQWPALEFFHTKSPSSI